MASLKISQVNKHYGAVQALHDVSIDIKKGEFVTLLGPSGSGKTTLLKILAGFEPVTSGSIILDGKDITTYKPEKRNFGLVFQGYALFPHLTVYENIAYPLRVRKTVKDELDNKIKKMLSLVQLEKFASRRPQELSGGQQQRVALARALVFEPFVLLLDEPMSALDKKLRHDLQDQLRDIHKNLGTTFINVTHDQDEAMHMSDRIAVMDHGRIQQYASGTQLYLEPISRFVAEFVGKSNLFEGEIVETTDGLKFKCGLFSVAAGNAKLAKATAMIRPEDIHISIGEQASDLVSVPATILASTYSGDRVLYSLKLNDGQRAIAYSHARSGIFPDNTPVFFCFKENGIVYLQK